MFKNTNNSVVAIAGCGGGYDVFGGLPLYFEIEKNAKKIILINFTFTAEQSLIIATEHNLAENIYSYPTVRNRYLYKVSAYEYHDGISDEYFPEALLADCLDHDIYTILIQECPTMNDIRQCYLDIIKCEGQIDCIYLVDGGCDVLLTGSECELGTPVEDMMHLKIISDLPIKEKYVMVVGLDVDLACGIHLNDLETRLKDLEDILTLKWKWDLNVPSIVKYKDIVNQCDPVNSIVQSLIVATLDGHSGYHTPEHLLERISKNIVSLNPRICTAYIYPLEEIAKSVIYLDRVTYDMHTGEVDDLINEVHLNITGKRS